MSVSSNPTGLCLFPTAIGRCGVAWRGDALVATNLPEDHDADTRLRLAKRAVGAVECDPPEVVRRAIARMTALLDGVDDDLLDIACDLAAVEPFALRVYEITRAIRPGTTSTYGEVAIRLGGKNLAQAVGRSLGRNPLPIVVPCHRVLGANGRLTGFSANGGVTTKLRMLAIEGAPISAPPSLFADLPLALKPHA